MLAAGVIAPTPRVWAQPRFARNPFTLGVASGYPQPDGIVLWTRLAPDPLDGGGMPNAAVEVKWEIAADEGFQKMIASGTEQAVLAEGHSVHAEIRGLASAHWYWYRFHAGDATSPVGKLRTAPPAGATDASLRFALASCQHYEHGYFSAYRHMAAEPLELVVHVGDYIYESSSSRNAVRQHGMSEAITLEGYRNRYAVYKSDLNLQAAHAACPWLVTWDDHEVSNDYANDRSQKLDPPGEFLQRRTAAYQAYYEHMPLPKWARPNGPTMQLYTRIAFGRLAQFHVLDGRQYRSPQVCPPPERGGNNWVTAKNCPEINDSALTFLGRRQEAWLDKGLADPGTRWNLIAQQTLVAPATRSGSNGTEYRTDGWDGYLAARKRLLNTIVERKPANPVVLGGDVHMAVVADLKADFNAPRSPVIASEFVCTSISSRGPGRKRTELMRQDHPHIHYADGTQRGYTSFELNAKRLSARLRVVADVKSPDSPIRDAIDYTVEDGRPGPQKL